MEITRYNRARDALLSSAGTTHLHHNELSTM